MFSIIHLSKTRRQLTVMPMQLPVNSSAAIAVAGLMALAVAMGIGRFAFTPILPMMQDDAGLTVAQGGWLASANYIGYLLGALWATAQTARAERAIRAALLAIGLATLGMGFAHDFVSWFLLRALAGIASAWALIHVSAWCLERLMPLGKPLLSGAVFTGVGCGIALAGGMCLVLMRAQASSAQAWISLGIVSLLVAVLVWPFLGKNEGPPRSRNARRRGYSWSFGGVRLVFCYGAFGFGYIIPATFVPVMARQAIPDAAVFGWAWPIFGLTAAASTLLVARVLQVLGNRRVWILATAAMAVGVAAPVALPSLAGVVAAAVLVGGTFMVITMAGMQEARQVAGADAPVLMGAMTSAFAAGQIVGPLSVSLLVDRQGDFSAALVLACGLLVLSALALAVKSNERRSDG
jgi:predicted MFS family arabinose efflux permease